DGAVQPAEISFGGSVEVHTSAIMFDYCPARAQLCFYGKSSSSIYPAAEIKMSIKRPSVSLERLTPLCLYLLEDFASQRLVRHNLQRHSQMRFRRIISAKLSQKHSKVAMDGGALRFQLQRFFVFADCFFVTPHRFV